MKILVVGGAGYIGSHVVRELLDTGNNITVFDNFSSGSKTNLFSESNFIKGDILNYSDISKAAAGYNAIIHLAAFKAAGESMIAPEKYSVNNITGTINILNAALENGIKNIVFSSSAAVYGEPEYTPVDEKHPVNPKNYYGFTKLEIERIMTWYDKLKGLRYASLRYFNAAGYDINGRIMSLEKNPANLIPIVMETAAGKRKELQIFGGDYDTPDGTCIRDYIHVNDLAVGHRLALDYIIKQDKSITVNLGSETGLSVLEIIETARKITGKKINANIVKRREGDPATLVSSAKKALEILEWKSTYSDASTLITTSWNVYRRQK
ncbi:MAG: UDP-glucose 4-epimerase GalE [Spirochaetaceae bacterium]|jgi:UDP-glucose 4-epimerase|nr:UDP-glucose 4-epimerase GalE [Spirochaetaceae bacterium]